jgi:hypothetical protein
MVRRASWGLLLVGAAMVSGHARGEGKALRIALYAPNAPFASGIDRSNYVTRLAQQISSVAGVSATGSAFAKAADLERAITAKQIDFAVFDGVYLAQKESGRNCFATATVGGETSPRWSLFAQSKVPVKSLQGKKLSLAATGGRDDDFIGNALFDGEVVVKKFFGPGLVKSPDLSSAVQAVSLGKADAVFAPESMGHGLQGIFEAGRIPNAAFCEVASGIDPAVVSKVKQAVIGFGVGAAIDGWKSADMGAYRALAGRLGAKSKRPFMAEPNPVKSEDLDVLPAPSTESQLPDLKSQFWYP